MGGADLLVSSWSDNLKSVPKNYILPPEQRPETLSISKDIPVVDLQQTASGQTSSDLLDKLMNASQEFGMFQVINHGMSDKLMQEARSLSLEFFKMTVEDKEIFYSEDNQKSPRLSTGGYNYNSEEIHYWKDTFNLPCHHIESWPENPARFQEVIGKYSGDVRKLSGRVLDLICEGLGLENGYFDTELSLQQGLLLHHYPPCPEPSLTIGIGPHRDAHLITFIQQDAYGFQCTNKDGQWLGVDPIPNAFIVVVGDQLEIISNGKLRSCEHRGVTNSEVDRISIVSLLGPDKSNVIGPATQLLSDVNPPLYKSYKYGNFLTHHLECLGKKDLSIATTLGPYQLQPT